MEIEIWGEGFENKGQIFEQETPIKNQERESEWSEQRILSDSTELNLPRLFSSGV